MTILGIETSCDETALCILDANGNPESGINIKMLANNVLSQIAIHKEYGGVFPMMAKREHAKNLVPLLKKTLEDAGLLESKPMDDEIYSNVLENIRIDWKHDEELKKLIFEFIQTTKKPKIDLISVTVGPGLEPCLWTGLNFAKALSTAWDIPVVTANHMEGHILVSLLKRNEELSSNNFQFPKERNTNYTLNPIPFPSLALLISGGHTELVLMKNWSQYEIVGRTRDDAIGEAFDKVARILGLPYPGGPEISALAEKARKFQNQESRIMNHELKLPRPMIKSDNLDFSFSGLKTAVLYLIQKLTQTDKDSVRAGLRPVSISPRLQQEVAKEFEDAATEVIVEKTKKAVEKYGVQTIILGGGVTANKNIRIAFQKLTEETGQLSLKIPEVDHSTDNALMIALAGFFNQNKALTIQTGLLDIKADGNLHF